MVSDLFFYELLLLGLLWLCVMLHSAWPSGCTTGYQRPSTPAQPPRQRSGDPKPFPGLTRKPHCPACEQAAQAPAVPPPPAPPPITSTRGRPRQVDTSQHFCPNPDCAYRGRVGLGNLSANGHPGGGRWRQLYCSQCEGYVLETHGTIFYGKRVPVELIVRVLACLAEGLGIRATARVFEVDPNTVLHWRVEAAEHLRTFSAYFLCEVHVTQLQLDEVYAVLREVKAGELSEDEAITRLERSPYWVWTAMDPESKLLVVIDVGTRTLEMAQRVVHQVVQVFAPDCVPLFVTDGFREYMTAFLTHFGRWIQPPRRQDKGPMPKPRWMPLPQLLYAQVVKSYRRRRMVGVTHRVVFGTQLAIAQVLTACGWTINTAFVERLNLDLRQRVAAVGRRVNTLCQGADGLQHQLVLFQTYHNFVLPHASLRQALLIPEATNGTGSARVWRPCTPAMAAGLTDRVWRLKEVLLFRVPPWPPTQMV
jgi:IS1 family transposase